MWQLLGSLEQTQLVKNVPAWCAWWEPVVLVSSTTELVACRRFKAMFDIILAVVDNMRIPTDKYRQESAFPGLVSHPRLVRSLDMGLLRACPP